MSRHKLDRINELLEFVRLIRLTSMPDTHKAMAYRAAERVARAIA